MNGQTVAALQKEGRPVTVRVYYGSWCSHCRRLVPHAIRLEQELKGSKIHFEYFGVSPNFTADPEVRKAVIQSIPTGIVYINGNEVGRILGDQAWQSPESTLRVILGPAARRVGRGRALPERGGRRGEQGRGIHTRPARFHTPTCRFLVYDCLSYTLESYQSVYRWSGGELPSLFYTRFDGLSVYGSSSPTFPRLHPPRFWRWIHRS